MVYRAVKADPFPWEGTEDASLRTVDGALGKACGNRLHSSVGMLLAAEPSKECIRLVPRMRVSRDWRRLATSSLKSRRQAHIEIDVATAVPQPERR